jgi:small conductance mechanosensitive channel
MRYLALLLAALVWMPAATALGQIPALDAPVDAAPEERYELEARPDSLIAERIRSVMQHVRAFREIDVAVRDGVVVLSGEVYTGQQRDDARELARRFDGVLWVDNRLEVSPDVEQRLAPAVERFQRFGSQFVAMLPLIGVIALLVVLLWMLGSVIARWETPATRFGMNPLVWNLIRRMARGILVLAGLILVFDLLGISALVGALLGTAGVAGIVLGFAFREIAENYLAGVLLSIRRPFAIGDLVRIGEYEGHVLRLTSRELVLLTQAGTHVRFPNATVFKSIVQNFTHNPRRRLEFSIGVGAEEDLGAAMRIGREVLAALPGVLLDPMPFVRVIDLGDSSVELRCFAWIDQRDTDFLKVRSEAIRVVKNAFDRADIAMPDPQFGVHVTRQREKRQLPDTEPTEEELDVRPDGKMDEQLREELSREDEENLLK